MLRSLLAVAVLSVASSASLAQAWPAKPVKYIVPFPPAGATDLISRPVAEKLRERLGQPVVIENIGGAGGSIGVGRLAQAPADGYVIGLGNSATHTITPNLLAKLPYDPANDFTPISLLTEYVNVLVVTSRLPAQDIKQFLQLARTKPAGLSYGSAGPGSSNHLTSEVLATQAGVTFTHVPYKGNGPALSDLAAGHVDWMFATIAEVRPLVQAGKIRALGISGRERDPLLPDVAPLRETLPNFEVVGFMGLFAPARLPPSIVARLNSEVRAILASPEMVERFTLQGMKARSSTPEELAARVTRDLALWKSVIAAAGIKPE